MDNSLYYLRQNVQVEPLVDRWFAWPHLIPPATYARNITERHLRIMQSYINAPQVHANAVSNPQMAGGPFIDYGGKRVDEIRELYDSTVRKRTRLLELSRAVQQLDDILRAGVRGFSLHPLYEKVPPSLRGFVELVYNLHNQPSFRLFESLLYRSPYYDRSAQSLMLSPIHDDSRPFILSTPRLPSPSSLELHTPFDSDVVDRLFETKTTPREKNEILELLAPANPSDMLFNSLFTAEAPPPYQHYFGTGVRWRYFGHACILVETARTSILVDPILSYTYESNVSRYTYADLPDKIDYVVITHNHQDHILYETMLQLRHKIGTIVIPKGGTGDLQDPSLRLTLEATGFRGRIVELSELEEIDVPGGYIKGLPFLGEHGDLNVSTKLGYFVRLGRRGLAFVADSCNIEPLVYKYAHDATGDADVLFVGMECDGAPFSWLYGPLLTQSIERKMDESRRLSGSDFTKAKQLVDQFGCKEVYVYAMGQEPWITHISSIRYTENSRPIVESQKLLEDCAARSICAERLFGEKEILIGP